MNVYFFTSEGRIQALAYEIAAAQHPEHEWRRFTLDTPEKRRAFEAEQHAVDLIISFLNPYVIPRRYLEAAGGRAYNVHPAPPSQPGVEPFHFAAYDGRFTAGATLHRMTEAVDAGEIYDVTETAVPPADGVRRLVDTSKQLALGLLVRNLDGLLADRLVPSNRAWTEANRRSQRDFEALCRIDPGIDADELARRVVAFSSPEHRTPFVEIHGTRFVHEPAGAGPVTAPVGPGGGGVSAQDVRAYVLAEVDEPLRGMGLSPGEVPDDFDLHRAGVIDSFGLIELINGIEEHFGLEVDFEDLDPEEMTLVGPLSRFIEERSRV